MYIWVLIVYKIFLEKAAQPKLIGNKNERIRGLISRLYNCTVLDIRRAHTTRKVFVERISFAVVRYFGVVLQIRVMSSLNDHIRRFF